MADDNRFAGIGDQLEEDADDNESVETTDSTSESPSDSSQTDATEEQEEQKEKEEEGGPAFSFEMTAQTSIYPRSETADDTLDDVEFEVEGILRRDHDIRDLAGRELHDAMIRLAADHPDEVAELIVELRDDSS